MRDDLAERFVEETATGTATADVFTINGGGPFIKLIARRRRGGDSEEITMTIEGAKAIISILKQAIAVTEPR